MEETYVDSPTPHRRYDDGSGSAQTIRQMVMEHDSALRELTLWKAELRGAFRLMTLVMGTSLISLVISIVTVVVLLAEHKP